MLNQRTVGKLQKRKERSKKIDFKEVESEIRFLSFNFFSLSFHSMQQEKKKKKTAFSGKLEMVGRLTSYVLSKSNESAWLPLKGIWYKGNIFTFEGEGGRNVYYVCITMERQGEL